MRRAGLKRREGFNIVQAKGCSQDSGMDFHLVVVCVVQQEKQTSKVEDYDLVRGLHDCEMKALSEPVDTESADTQRTARR